jgi:general secretion pathway protein E
MLSTHRAGRNGKGETLDIPGLVEALLDEAVRRKASDVHVEPLAEGCEVRFRIDGFLQPAEKYSAEVGRLIVTRLMVLAKLLTYRAEMPQEGRATVTLPSAAEALELRVATVPTTHGVRAAVRLPAELIGPHNLDELGLPSPAMEGLRRFAAMDAGMLLVAGPAGSGKTSTLYALLGHIAAANPGLSIVALEDPVERDLPGVTQIEVSAFGPLTYERALRSMLRQDPQVLMLGEIRDAATASLAVQAALSGHRLCSTLHAASPAGALARLLEMGIEPYQLASSVVGVLAQRLVRRCASSGERDEGEISRAAESRYSGRVPLAELAELNGTARAAVLRRADIEELEVALGTMRGYRSLSDSARELLATGLTDEAEIVRVLGTAWQERGYGAGGVA